MCSLLFRFFLLVCLSVGCLGQGYAAVQGPAIVLKLDDLVATGAKNGAPVSPRWLRVTEFLEQRKIRASYGIIGFSLEAENLAYFNWIKALQAKGQIEFWNHGYYPKKSEQDPREFEGTLEEQKTALQKTQALAQEKLGFALKAFGPHWSGVNLYTEQALDSCPEITSWFGLQPNLKSVNPSRFVFSRYLALENPTFVPDFAKFKAAFDKVSGVQPVLALQGHPNQWDDARWAGFVQIIDYLQSLGCRFVQPSEWRPNVDYTRPPAAP